MIGRLLRRVTRTLCPRGRRRRGRGRHRRPPVPPQPGTPRRRTLVLRPHRPPYLPGQEPSRPRRVPDELAALDGDAAALVRPYLVAHEQRMRRRALALATLGQDMPEPLRLYEMPEWAAYGEEFPG
ncbi:hypothetical protein [Streptomyces sp. HNM0574]|uniref:hypothetical protein n=1 Tax=Streptomyces sp. HNM0574 TaxID=2714954 RepID=UPI003216F545